MKVTLCMTIYNRADLLEKTLENILFNHPCGADQIILVSDGASEDVLKVAKDFKKICVSKSITTLGIAEYPHLGIAQINNAAMSLARSSYYAESDIIIRSDSDFYIDSPGWATKLGQFLVDHPEVGIAAPDWPGHYMRINRPGYDEIEYAMGAILACRGEVYDKVSQVYGVGFFDQEISHQWDPDVCYRARMLGYRIGIIPVGGCVNLGEGTGDSAPPVLTKDSSPTKGGFQFLKKWNLFFTGQFRYKSPMMLRWDEFPLNYLWRKLWLSQFNINRPGDNAISEIQGHRFEMVRFPISVDRWNESITKASVEKNLVFTGVDTLCDTDLDLLTGKRMWVPDDLQTT